MMREKTFVTVAIIIVLKDFYEFHTCLGELQSYTKLTLVQHFS